MNAAQRIRIIRLIEKIDKNPEFSNKIGVKNISEFTTEMQKKKQMKFYFNKARRRGICYKYCRIDENKRERCNYCISQRDMVLYRQFNKSVFNGGKIK